MSSKKLLVSALRGTIYDAVPLKDGTMSDNRTDRTMECVRAVMLHMDVLAKQGAHTYIVDGLGALTFVRFPKEGDMDAAVSAMSVREPEGAVQ